MMDDFLVVSNLIGRAGSKLDRFHDHGLEISEGSGFPGGEGSTKI
jgi:hypothetical protein